MINCALTPKQLASIYKVTWLSMKDQNKKFDPDTFMQSIFDKIKDKSDVENAAKFIQPIPDLVISLAVANRKELKGLGLKVDFNELDSISESFFDEENGISTIINNSL